MKPIADLILQNGRITTLDPSHPSATEIVIAGDKFAGVDNSAEMQRGPQTKVIDLKGRRVVPGLYDSDLHVIRGGLNYNMELRWEGVPSLSLALQMLREQAARTPAPQWVRVVGGWTEFQFVERRMPTLEEINAAAPDTPVFVLHLYCRALLNRAALKACGYTKDTPNPPGGEIVRDKAGNPTGMLIARPNATILYATLAKGPKLPPEYQYNSTRHFMRELNRLGVTSVCDAGGGYQNYPEDYEIIQQLHQRGEMTLRIAYNLFTQKPGGELEDFVRWSKVVKPQRTPPLRRMLEMGVPVGAGTDATRVASYNPFVSLYWMTTGKTVGGLGLYPENALLSREEALRLYTQGSTWMSREEGKRGAISPGQLADLVVLTDDYFTIPDEEIKSLESVLTILGGKPVYAVDEFKPLDPGDLPVMPDWSPVHHYPGYWRQEFTAHLDNNRCCGHEYHAHEPARISPFNIPQWMLGPRGLLDGGCDCFAF